MCWQFLFSWRGLRSVLGLLFAVGFPGVTHAQEKRIMLRNQVIVTSLAQKRQPLAAQSTDQPVNGLYLVQLANHPPADWRARLEAEHLQLLRPVPEDAFVVECQNANIEKIEALPFVQFTGPYRPEYKTHPWVQQMAHAASVQRVRVRALLSPKANGLQTAILQRTFRALKKYTKTRVGTVLEGDIMTSSLNRLMESQAVLWIEPAPEMKLNDGLAVQIIGGESETDPAGVAVHDLGFTGKNVSVAVADSGLDEGVDDPIHPDLKGRVDAFYYYGNLTDASDEHSHGTHVTGIIAGDGASGEMDENGYPYGLGVAPESHIVVQRIFDGLGGFEPPDSNARLTQDAVRAGAVIGSNSWGDDVQGRYDTSAMEFDGLVRDADPDTLGDQQYILEFSAGNAGPGEKTMDSPAVAKNVIATGASQNNRFDFFIYADGQESMADFSSRGPCEDGRIKPDVVAPGTWIASLQSSAATDENAWAPISDLYQYEGGTSQAGPHVSGAAAVIVQYYRETHAGVTPSPALVKAALINSAVDMDNGVGLAEGGTTYVPNNDEGWGRVDLSELIGSERRFDFTDQSAVLTNGQVFEKHIVIASVNRPFKATLAYTDVPGFPAAIPALVNDLDLEVIAPDGTVYRGNNFVDGDSAPNPGSFDSVNNVEGVHLAAPVAGEYIVRVIAHKVIEDARRDTAAIDQDFALVVSGDVPFPGQGVIAMDRRAYTVPSAVNLKLIDFDLAGRNSATVSVSATSQPQPLAVTLLPDGNTGVFTGAVQVVTLPAANDGRLHVAQNDTIEASYDDASPLATVTASARVDLLPPVISGVTATNRFGKEVVIWQTDEPATSAVFFGTNAPSISVTNARLATEHEVQLVDLQPGATYRFYIVSRDEAGNIATNDNRGALFTFVPAQAATVLLVNAYTHGTDSDSIDIPVTEYTDALDQTGVSYEVWNVPTDGSPAASDLAPFKVVIWRINDSFWDTDNTITSSQQGTISDYVAGGGAFMISSMDVLTRLGDVPFRTNILQVAEFKQNSDPFSECPDCDEDHGVTEAAGSSFEAITAGMDIPLDYSEFPSLELEPFAPNIGPDLADIFTPTTNAVPILTDGSGGVVGIKYPRTGQDSSGRVVFLTFPLEAVPMDGPAPNNRAALLKNLLSFLAPGLNGLGTLSLDSRSYTVPSRVTIELADSDLAGRTSVVVAASAAPSGSSVSVELLATVRPGVFRGFVALVNSNQPPGLNRLPVRDRDLIKVTYMDSSANANVEASAAVDLVFPAVQDVSAEPDYETAEISWTTSEPSDALVQFGESTFLGKTAYRPRLDTAHSLTLTSLLPDKTYYYQISSRDAAGNTTIEDNGGKLYTFHTLKPIRPPWSDNMEKGALDWGVQNADDVEGRWTLGAPKNGIVPSAHSGTNCWGSNLEGSNDSYTESYLVTPSIELSGGNLATLKFWHAYDFTPEATIESAELLLFTNSQTLPITLATYSDASDGWEQEEFDLTPYLGKVITLAWHYALLDFNFDTVVLHPGWVVDDVSVEVTNVTYGTIQITNNLAAASFTVSGPTPISGTGKSLLKKNAFGGEYVISYGDVPYYFTPPPQTNTLTASEPLVFTGIYTFEDANQNGISDAWEQEHFQNVSPSRTGLSDSDADGMNDFAEFTAGTDPLDAGSRLQMNGTEVLSGNRVKLTWASVPDKTYQIFGSSDAITWQPYGTPIRAAAEETAYTLPPSGSAGSVYFYKLEVIP